MSLFSSLKGSMEPLEFPDTDQFSNLDFGQSEDTNALEQLLRTLTTATWRKSTKSPSIGCERVHKALWARRAKLSQDSAPHHPKYDLDPATS